MYSFIQHTYLLQHDDDNTDDEVFEIRTVIRVLLLKSFQ